MTENRGGEGRGGGGVKELRILGRLGTTFEVRYHLGLPGGGWNGQNCPNFIRGGPCREQQERKNTNQNRWQAT